MKYYINLDRILWPLNNRILDELSSSFKKSLSEESEKTLSESWIAYEERFLRCVEQGDVEGVQTFLRNSQVSMRVGYDLHDELLQARYALVSAVTILARAAIKGGLNENESFLLGDTYLQKSAELKDSNQILGLVLAASLEYTKMVNRIRTTPKHSPIVAFCCSYITEHIHENISLDELAKACDISTGHLSRMFKKETGYTIKKYCLSKKWNLQYICWLIPKGRYKTSHYSWAFHPTGAFRDISGSSSGKRRRNTGRSDRVHDNISYIINELRN